MPPGVGGRMSNLEESASGGVGLGLELHAEAMRRRAARPERVRERLPLSPNEERYVLDAVMSRDIYGNPWTMRIQGDLDVPRFIGALQQTCDRHELRRSGYEPSEDGRFTRY